MESGFTLLMKKVCNNRVSEAFWAQVTGRENRDPHLSFERVLSQRIATYFPETVDEGGRDEVMDQRWSVLDRLVDSVPSLLFRLVSDWSLVTESGPSSRHLLMGVLSSLVWQEPESQAHIDAFLADIDPRMSIKELSARLIQKTAGKIPVPQAVYRDFMIMAGAPFKLAKTDDLAERIENLFYFDALVQFLLTYYFDLFCRAKTETVIGYVHIIFLRLFSAIKQQEKQYWDQYPEKERERQLLTELVEADSPDSRHPFLRNTAFKSIELYNPLFTGFAGKGSTVIENRYQQRLSGFLSLSVVSMSLLLDSLLLLKGEESVLALLKQLRDSSEPKLKQLAAFLGAEKQKGHKILAQIVMRFLTDKPAREETERKSTPEQVEIQKPDAESSVTKAQIAGYLEDRLLKLHEQAGIKVETTQNQIGDFLTSICGGLAQILANGNMDLQEVDEYIKQIEPEIKEMSALGMLAREEKEAFLAQMSQRAEKFMEGRSSTPEESAPDTAETTDPFFQQEIIPIGFEKGAPKIPIGIFFRFPFAREDGKPEDPFSQHFRYLEEAVKQSLLTESQLAEIRSRLPDLPRLNYRKTYDIYPLNRFDETILLIVFSLWRNGALDNLLAGKAAGD
ncbi:MAG: hypothetical protein HOK67_27420 [Deltaproteobacteria bacterium]|jgi:hypothetical protein|nr:hypothetical protein [Deltaproteobacteria bacterium]MBT4644119.1 hypothetical protein [Deltaproteobacteria bacterium]MBT6503629.1 hypothetical protein [Deltaproteobacteria bacterium]